MLASLMTISIDAVTGAFDAMPSWLSALSGIIAAASAVTALTPTPRDDRIVGKAYRLLDLLALNIGRAKDSPPNRRGAQ